MGLLVDGQWQDKWYDTSASGGRFERSESQFRDFVTVDGAPVSGRTRGFKAEPGRYHLYVSLACPWAHRTLILRTLKKLEGIISISIVDHFMGKDGWTFVERDGSTGDTLYGSRFLHQIYTKADPNYSGRVTVPILWDKHQKTIVSNESSEIIRMLNKAFDAWGDDTADFYPDRLAADIDAWNDRVYGSINNGVYRCGFATTQEAYEEAFDDLFGALDAVEEQLSKNRYLTGNTLTEADWRLFTTLVRFDPVYFGHFKSNLRRIADYPNLWNYTCDLYQVPGVAETVDLHHIKHHYYASHETINPTRIVPRGPQIDYARPSDRNRFDSASGGQIVYQ
ncbi:glutathione S-transferase family protein [Aquibium carbonis]|uniref:Glutathione S-transferase family protein n=1 Tax=Aquibium carbonis TaxID=2495581 RepID=A0A429Z2N8_9HYPH|nr:glutathione S-transferase family protein [Aquibium carbonis]RST87975.1 glutathione S-transferase family protein [Aquibium carbonis]